MTDLVASAVARSKAVIDSTESKSATVWFPWVFYLRQINIDDIFLSPFSQEDRWKVLVGFCSALWDGRFQPGKRKGISIQNSLGAVTLYRHNDPGVDDRRNTDNAFILQ
jgi:hypothetical protein